MSEPVEAVEDRGPRLSIGEDAELRRLHWFEQFGCQLSDALAVVKTAFRSRDRRTDVRDPYAQRERVAERKTLVVEQSGDYWVRVRK